MPNKKSILLDILLTFITFGLWNIWVQYRQMRDYNKMHMNKEYSFIVWAIFCLLTFGLYHIYHEYKLTKDILILGGTKNPQEYAIICAIATAFGLWFIVDSYQQAVLNEKVDTGIVSIG